MTSGPVNRPFDHPTLSSDLGRKIGKYILRCNDITPRERSARRHNLRREQAVYPKDSTTDSIPFLGVLDRKTTTVGENSQDWHLHYDESFPMHLHCTHERRRAEKHSERNSSVPLRHLLLILIFQ
jgi:hypothetical protein